MKKLFLLLPALVLALTTHAAVININNSTADALRKALNSAVDGDIIEMAAGTYVESNGNYIAFTGKEVTVRAAEGAEVILQPQVSITISEGGKAILKNIKIDASHLNEIKSYAYVIYASDANVNNRLEMDGCELYGYNVNNSAIYCSSSNKLVSVTINNCYFHNNRKSCMFFQNTDMATLTITNSTFANIYLGDGDTSNHYAGVIDSRATSGSLLVDHCTFYNVQAMNTDYAAIGKVSMTSGAVVSNCIFALSTSGASSNRTIRDHVAANNCLVYNYTTDSNYGMQSDVTKTNCVIADPLFTDAANGDFSLAGNWVTGSISPARGAATDGSDLGDPRWYSPEVLPETNFATAYDLIGTKAKLAGNIRLEEATNNIEYYDKQEPGTATWKLHIGKACAIGAVADRKTGSTSGCTLTLTAYDANGNEVSAIAAARSENDNDINFPSCLYIPEEGDYTIILTNGSGWSSAILEKITLSYFGGAVVDVASDANTTLNVADALFTEDFTRADGQISPGSWKPSERPLGYVKWNIATSETKFYDLTLNFTSTNAHSMAVNIYEDEESSPVATISESYTSTTGTLTIAGRINLVGGKNYVVKVTNPTSGSEAKVTNVVFAPVAASATELPNTLAFANAVLSERAHITDGNLYFAPIGDTNPVGEWAQWAVTTDHPGLFLFTMNVNSTNEQSYRITILDGDDNVIDYYEAKPSRGAQTLTHYFDLVAGNYNVKVENTTAWSHGYLTSFVVSEPANIITLDEAAENNSAWVDYVVNDDNASSPTHTVRIKRTLLAGMYNTFCLPFAVSSDMCKDLFGTDVEIYTLDEAVVDASGFMLDLTLKASSGIYQGTPVFIRPSRKIVDPVFADVVFKRGTPSPTTKTNANFTGTFTASTIPGNADNLFLAEGNLLYYPTSDIEVLGMRGWLVIHDSPAPAAALHRANIITPAQVTTSIQIVGQDSDNTVQKRIQDGQLLIIRDGVRYNSMGMRLK